MLSFLMARALGTHSNDQGELAALVFEPLYRLVATNHLSATSWRYIEPLLAWELPWLSWDRGGRLRGAFADLVVEADMPPMVFEKAIVDDLLFVALVERMARTSRGRRYLTRSEEWLKHAETNTSPRRLTHIQDALGDY